MKMENVLDLYAVDVVKHLSYLNVTAIDHFSSSKLEWKFFVLYEKVC